MAQFKVQIIFLLINTILQKIEDATKIKQNSLETDTWAPFICFLINARQKNYIKFVLSCRFVKAKFKKHKIIAS